MKNVNPGTIVCLDNKVYIVKKKLGVLQCWHCAMLPNCQAYLAEHMFTACFDFLIHNPINSHEAGLILRKPFKLTKKNVEKHWPQHSVIEVNGEVGIVVTNYDTHKHNLAFTCANCLLQGSDDNCRNFRCLPTERRDCLSTILLPIETAIYYNLIQVIKIDKYND